MSSIISSFYWEVSIIIMWLKIYIFFTCCQNLICCYHSTHPSYQAGLRIWFAGKTVLVIYAGMLDLDELTSS